MAAPQETGQAQAKTWAERFKDIHPLEHLPQELRQDFETFLTHRQIIIDYFSSFPQDRMDEGIGKGDSARKELIHMVNNSSTRIYGLQQGEIPSWEEPIDARSGKVRGLDFSTEELLGRLKATTVVLYDMYKRSPIKIIGLPYGKSNTGAELLYGTALHEVGHAFACQKFADHFGTPRPQSMKNRWG